MTPPERRDKTALLGFFVVSDLGVDLVSVHAYVSQVIHTQLTRASRITSDPSSAAGSFQNEFAHGDRGRIRAAPPVHQRETPKQYRAPS